VKTIEDRQEEGRGFTAAGFGSSDQIASGEGYWNRAGLDWCWIEMSSFADRLQYYR
jgi:hypothetical protein